MHVLSVLLGHLRIGAAGPSELSIFRHDGRCAGVGEDNAGLWQTLLCELTAERKEVNRSELEPIANGHDFRCDTPVTPRQFVTLRARV